jgi:antitoxin YefM
VTSASGAPLATAGRSRREFDPHALQALRVAATSTSSVTASSCNGREDVFGLARSTVYRAVQRATAGKGSLTDENNQNRAVQADPIPPIGDRPKLPILMAMSELPLADVRNRLSELVAEVESTHARVVVTKHGHPAAVLISPDDLASLEETLDILSTRGRDLAR